MRDGEVSVGLPGKWCALECEIYAVYWALHRVVDRRPITVFVDCLPVVEMLGGLGSIGGNKALVELFSEVLSWVGPVLLVWIPGYRGIGGNAVADMVAKRGCGKAVDGMARCGVVMNVRNGVVARELRGEEWKAWHRGQGRAYYAWLPSLRDTFMGFCVGMFMHWCDCGEVVEPVLAMKDVLVLVSVFRSLNV